MPKYFSSLPRTVATGFVLAILVYFFLTHGSLTPDTAFWAYLLRYLHIISGVMWIGLLWYLNFVQVPSMAVIPAEQKPAVTKVIAPRALFWFRHGAMATLISGLLLAWVNGYLADALSLGNVDGSALKIGIGMWLAIIMWFNVWFIIWPNQKKVLGIVQADADAVARAAKIAGMTSRINTMLSIPMLLCMAAQSHIG